MNFYPNPDVDFVIKIIKCTRYGYFKSKDIQPSSRRSRQPSKESPALENIKVFLLLFPSAFRIWFRTHSPLYKSFFWDVKRFLSSYVGVELPNCETTRVLAAGPVERSEAVPWAQAAAVRAAHAPPLAARGQSSIFLDVLA